MSFGTQRERDALDRYITGNYGEDQFRGLEEAVCQMCGAHLFETDPELSAEHGSTVWSHDEDTGCDDPTPLVRTEVETPDEAYEPVDSAS